MKRTETHVDLMFKMSDGKARSNEMLASAIRIPAITNSKAISAGEILRIRSAAPRNVQQYTSEVVKRVADDKPSTGKGSKNKARGKGSKASK